MRPIVLLIAALALRIPTARAATGGSTSAIKVPLLDLLALTNGGTITLDAASANMATGVIGPVTDTAALLNYTQNGTGTKKITAQVTANPGGGDITLTVSVASGAGEKALVSSGVTGAAQDVYTNIAAGALTNLNVTYKAWATASGTPVSSSTNFVFTVTYTSVGT